MEEPIDTTGFLDDALFAMSEPVVDLSYDYIRDNVMLPGNERYKRIDDTHLKYWGQYFFNPSYFDFAYLLTKRPRVNNIIPVLVGVSTMDEQSVYLITLDSTYKIIDKCMIVTYSCTTVDDLTECSNQSVTFLSPEKFRCYRYAGNEQWTENTLVFFTGEISSAGDIILKPTE